MGLEREAGLERNQGVVVEHHQDYFSQALVNPIPVDYLHSMHCLSHTNQKCVDVYKGSEEKVKSPPQEMPVEFLVAIFVGLFTPFQCPQVQDVDKKQPQNKFIP